MGGSGLLPGSDAIASQPSLGGSGAAPGSGLWSGSGKSGLMPGWLPSEGLLSMKDDDGSAAGGAGSKGKKEIHGKKDFKDELGDRAGGGGGDRGGKAKKRGGTNNRGKGADTGKAHGGK